VICVPRAGHKDPPETYGRFQRVEMNYPALDLPTDDWPFLYLSKRTIPSDYLVVIISLVEFSVMAAGLVRGASLSSSDAHFFFMGFAFLLLQTKSITDCSLYFGTTW